MGAEKGVNNGSVSSSRCFRRRVVVVGYRKEKKKENCKFHGSPRRFWGKKTKKKQKNKKPWLNRKSGAVVPLAAFTNEKKKNIKARFVLLYKSIISYGDSLQSFADHGSAGAPDHGDFSLPGQSWWLCPKLSLSREAG